MSKEELKQQLKEGFPNRMYIDCLACDNAHSTEDNKLHCMMKDTIVEEDDLCEEFI